MKKAYNAPVVEWIIASIADIVTFSELVDMEEGTGDNWDW